MATSTWYYYIGYHVSSRFFFFRFGCFAFLVSFSRFALSPSSESPNKPLLLQVLTDGSDGDIKGRGTSTTAQHTHHFEREETLLPLRPSFLFVSLFFSSSHSSLFLFTHLV